MKKEQHTAVIQKISDLLWKRLDDKSDQNLMTNMCLNAAFENWLSFEAYRLACNNWATIGLAVQHENKDGRKISKDFVLNEVSRIDLVLGHYDLEQHAAHKGKNRHLKDFEVFDVAVELKLIYNNKNWEPTCARISDELAGGVGSKTKQTIVQQCSTFAVVGVIRMIYDEYFTHWKAQQGDQRDLAKWCGRVAEALQPHRLVWPEGGNIKTILGPDYGGKGRIPLTDPWLKNDEKQFFQLLVLAR